MRALDYKNSRETAAFLKAEYATLQKLISEMGLTQKSPRTPGAGARWGPGPGTTLQPQDLWNIP